MTVKFCSTEKNKNGKDKGGKGTGVQLAGMIAVVAGIIYEIITKAHIGFFLITAGSLMFAIGTKIKGK